MFIFILFLLLIGLCFIIYIYFTNKIVLLRKQIMLLSNQNDELKSRIKRLIDGQNQEKHKGSIPNPILENTEFEDIE